MTLTADWGCEEMEMFNRLLRNTDESSCCLSDHSWTFMISNASSPQRNGADDFLEALLHDSSSSVPASPLWSPCTPCHVVHEDSRTDPAESPHSFSCTASPACDTHTSPQPPSLKNQPDVFVDLDWESDGFHEEFGLVYCQNPLLPSGHSLTVKDLLLSDVGQAQISQHSLQELVLNEDEKKLLAKEGVDLPCKLPLSKSEERILKKIRRKIRNKHSAQESRKKKREYVDNLEGRMAACSTQNLQLQRKVLQLEETNNALLEQLNQLQALLPNSSSKTTNRGTCILVLLFSFSLLISSNLQPDPYSQRSHAEYSDSKACLSQSASSRSMHSMDEVGDIPPSPPPSLLPVPRGSEDLRSLKETLWGWMDLPCFHHRQDHRPEDDYHWYMSRNM
nr:cyclic AMP-responsive element-binding protein 3-like protein 3-A isoform X2 [Nothobranchius furzeri]